MWYYLEGVANMLSQFRVASLSKWMTSYDTEKYDKTGNTKHLCYEVTTGEGKHCKFLPTPCTVTKDKADIIFWENVLYHGTAFGNVICHSAFVRITGVIEDESEGESDEEEDEVPLPLLDNPDSNLDDEDDDEESLVNNNNDNEIAFVTDDIIAIETVKQSKQRFSKRD